MDKTKMIEIKKADKSYNTVRLLSQFEYAYNFADAHSDISLSKFLDSELLYFLMQYRKDGCITNQTLHEIESHFNVVTNTVKSTIIHCVGHAHIDMNWMWGYDETVDVTLKTFKSVLRLMNEYPEFTFSQSQATVYEIVDKYDQEMLEEIKQRIKEGRWEVTASFWTESDKNMPSTESLIKNQIYTKKYLSRLLDIQPDSIQIDFEPDTFGHPINLPEILEKGNIKYYYFCRGQEAKGMFIWKSPSGSSALAYQEPIWYNAAINPYDFSFYPLFLKSNKLSSGIKVYGVGDHGGGPTKNDIDMLIDMNQWPLMPQIKFSSYNNFFNDVNHTNFPVISGEINPIFEGCYTSQSQIKSTNKAMERELYIAEITTLFPIDKRENDDLSSAWKNVLFNQFHDILTGSGTRETKNFAMGKYQEAKALIDSVKSRNLQQLADDITLDDSTRSGILNYLVFNPLINTTEKLVEIPLWDLKENIHQLEIFDSSQNPLNYVVMDSAPVFYWSHHYQRIAISMKMIPLGYELITIKQKQTESIPFFNPNPAEQGMRVHQIHQYSLENEFIKVIFDNNGSINQLIKKSNSKSNIIQKDINTCLRLIYEDATKGMTAWNIGKYISVKELTDNVVIRNDLFVKNNLYQQFAFETTINNSKVVVIYRLDIHSKHLDIKLDLDWQEIGNLQHGVPSLELNLCHNGDIDHYDFDCDNVIISRTAEDKEVYANNFLVANINSLRIALVNKDNYGYHISRNDFSLKLIRSSIDPDKYPEIGHHVFSIGLVFLDNQDLFSQVDDYLYSFESTRKYKDNKKLSSKGSLLSKVEGTCKIIFLSKNGHSVTLRAMEVIGTENKIKVNIPNIVNAYYTDYLGNKLGELRYTDDYVEFNLNPYEIKTIIIEQK